jgi:hypothetical protein
MMPFMTPILHFMPKAGSKWVSATEGIPQDGTGFDFYVCKIKV